MRFLSGLFNVLNKIPDPDAALVMQTNQPLRDLVYHSSMVGRTTRDHRQSKRHTESFSHDFCRLTRDIQSKHDYDVTMGSYRPGRRSPYVYYAIVRPERWSPFHPPSLSSHNLCSQQWTRRVHHLRSCPNPPFDLIHSIGPLSSSSHSSSPFSSGMNSDRPAGWLPIPRSLCDPRVIQHK